MSDIAARFRLRQGEFLLDVDFTAPPRGITALFGPSGAGKSTLLRCVVGLQRVADGYLRVRDEIWQEGRRFVPVHRRAVGYVFQEPSLFPHLTVRGNLDYGYRRTPARERRLHPDEVIALLGVEPLLAQRPATLSGGQRQRVAIARALLASPRLLLMDEPLASLDLASRAEILPYLEQLHDRLDLPVIYVSHAPAEVARLADHLLLMKQGRISASGALNDLLTDPALPLAQQEEAAAVLTGRVASHDADYGLMAVAIGAELLWVSRRELPLGHAVRLRILARDVSVALTPLTDSSINNVVPVSVAAIDPTADTAQMLLRLRCDDGQLLLARITRRSLDRLAIGVGARVQAQIKSAALWRR